MTNTLDGFVADMKSGIYDYTVDGQCSNCGHCCSNILPMSRKEIKEIRRYIEKHKIKEQIRFSPMVNTLGDLTCPFRSDVEKKCLIYPVRPAICRDFQCDKPRKNIQADRNMYCGKYEEIDLRAEFYGAEPVLDKVIRDMLQNKG